MSASYLDLCRSYLYEAAYRMGIKAAINSTINTGGEDADSTEGGVPSAKN